MLPCQDFLDKCLKKNNVVVVHGCKISGLRSKDKNIGQNFLQLIKNLDSIKFDRSIGMFHDINELIILFHEKNNKTLDNITNQCTNNLNNTHCLTKKALIKSNTNKKTKRKQYKENRT